MFHKKIWPIVLFSLVIILFNGCSQKGQDNQINKQVQIKSPNYQIGVLLSKANNDYENEKVVNGINRAVKELVEVKTKILKPGDFVDSEEGLRYLAENSYDLVIAVGDEEAKVANQLAREYPEVSFAIINVPTYSPNLASLQFRDEEGVFISGVLAALLTKSKKVAFVGGLEKMPEKRYQKAFIQGVSYIKKEKDLEIEVLTEYTGDNWDDDKINETVKKLSKKGVDIFFNGFGRNEEEVILAAAENKKYAVGIGVNQRVTAPKYVYTSVIDNLENLIYRFIINSKTKGFKGGTQYFGLTNDCVSLLNFDKLAEDEKRYLSKNNKNISSAVKAVEANKDKFSQEIIDEIFLIKQKIKTGKIAVNN